MRVATETSCGAALPPRYIERESVGDRRAGQIERLRAAIRRERGGERALALLEDHTTAGLFNDRWPLDGGMGGQLAALVNRQGLHLAVNIDVAGRSVGRRT